MLDLFERHKIASFFGWIGVTQVTMQLGETFCVSVMEATIIADSPKRRIEKQANFSKPWLVL